MIKQVSVTGPNGRFEGTIQVVKKTGVKPVTNASTHDEEMRPYTNYEVYATVGNKIYGTHLKGILEHAVLSSISVVEKELEAYLERLANMRTSRTLEDQLSERGFTNKK